MSQNPAPPVTQRAYTLRLRRGPGKCPACQKDACDCWRDALWATHEAVNRGAKAFGDWLLTLRGGLCHTLADIDVPAKGKKPARNPTKQEQRDRRVLLALSWLSVEDERGAPNGDGLRIATGKEPADKRGEAVKAALRNILGNRGVNASEADSWVKDCEASLAASIRDDAVWVNRSAAFDAACNGQNLRQAREDARTLLWYLLTDDYLVLPKANKKESEDTREDQEEGQDEESAVDEAAEAVAKSAKGAGQRTRHLFSHIFGRQSTQGFGKPPCQLDLRDYWQGHLKPLIEAAGIPLSDPNVTAKKGAAPSPTELHREMFSKAASRLAQIWTKQKQQEVARQLRAAADDELKELESDQTYSKALDLLEAYCRERGQITGSLEEYRINPRAVEGWERVVAAWEGIKNSDPTEAQQRRIDEVKRLQDESDDKKFGDNNLFVSLAEPEYEPVWQHKGQATPSVLKTFVKGWKARSDAARLKVAAFRHPDPYSHPVFCQFGVSRPWIKHGRLDPKGNAGTVQMLLWTGSKADKVQISAVSKRFDAEIGSASESTVIAARQVARRHRLAVAAVSTSGAGVNTIRVAHVFDQQEVRSRERAVEHGIEDENGDDESQNARKKGPIWNGTLQADRQALKAIGKLASSQKAPQAYRCLQWRLTVALELQSSGPWYDYVRNATDQSPFQRTVRKDEDKGKKRKKGTKYLFLDGWPFEEVNNPLKVNRVDTLLLADKRSARGREAKIVLSRLPGLRVLSVDLGHRYAAACAVWEALPNAAFKGEVAGLKVRAGGPGEDDLYLHVEKPGDDGKTKTVIYRRIGPDSLPDGQFHPAPWARLDRQFLIRLQGEDEEAREASNEEIWKVHQLEAELGRTVPLIDRMEKGTFGQTEKQKQRLEALRGLGWTPATTNVPPGAAGEEEGETRIVSRSVDELMFAAVRTMRLALRRHGDRARIAFAMTGDHKPMPGGRKYYFDEAKGASASDDEATRRSKRIEFLQDALSLWHDLFSSRGWKDDAAKKLWEQSVATLSGYQTPEEIAEDLTAIKRKKKREENRDRLRAAAEALAADDRRRKELHDAWTKRWELDDAQWKRRLRWFKDWVLPRGKAGNDPGIRHVGGLSLTRLATLTEFRRKVQVGYFTRLHPDGMKRETRESFGQATLDALDRLRDQRVKQLASRIVEAALGIGRIKTPKGGKMPKRPGKAVDDPCHAVVIESLTHYRPDDLRTRRENRQLMTWSSSKVKKYLAEACQLNGLHLREVPAGYTSRQDSRTGAPGIRCQDVRVKEFMQSPFWRKQVAQAEKKRADGKGDARERFLFDLNTKWKSQTEAAWESAGSVRIPLKGGGLFVSTDPRSPAANGIQADLNAAANIGLRALLDPDWPGRWWYVPCKAGTSEPASERIKGSAAFKNVRGLPADGADRAGSEASTGQPRKNKGGASREIENLWRDPSSEGLAAGHWKQTQAYWNDVQYRAVQLLRKRARLDSDG
jgi:predicted nucleic acid-binding protein